MVDLTVPASRGYTTTLPGVGLVGFVSYRWLAARIHEIVNDGSVTPDSLPIIVTYLVGTSAGNAWHDVETLSLKGGGTQPLPYIFSLILGRPGISGYSDVRPLSHELAECLNDPFGNTAVPGWSATEECGTYLEVADPLDAPAGSGVQVDGYDLQDTAFFSWFARQSPSIGINDRYTLFGTGGLTTPPPVSSGIC